MHADLLERRDEEGFLPVLGEDQHEGKGAFALADVAERHARRVPAAFPQVDRRELDAVRDRLVGNPELAVELERARVHHERAGGRAGRIRLVDDAHVNARPLEPEREHEARGAGADDQHLIHDKEKTMNPRRRFIAANAESG